MFECNDEDRLIADMFKRIDELYYPTVVLDCTGNMYYVLCMYCVCSRAHCFYYFNI